MPELPEVEITRRGLEPHLLNQQIQQIILHRQNLRWPIPPQITQHLPHQTITAIQRRAKYLLIDTPVGSALLHLGMSGSLRVLPQTTPAKTHDHVDIILNNQQLLRFNDPRRFGCLLWQPPNQTHPLLQHLGPEPLSDQFHGDYLYALSRNRQTPIKSFIMNQRTVVGVGNIYIAESLFKARISPLTPATKVSRPRYRNLADAIKQTLTHAITQGGTTLKDFIKPDGSPGYFEQELLVYGRQGQPCPNCARPLHHANIAQRTTVWCRHCQR